MAAFTRRYFSTFVSYYFLIRLGNASRYIFPTPTFAGLRAADNQFEILPTPNPETLSDISKRFSNDPAICGWVEGDDGNPVSCSPGYVCASVSTFVGCCASSNIKENSCEALFTTCYDGRGKSCDAACSSNSAALICNDQTRDYCAIYRYASGSRGYGCAISTGYNKTVLTTTSSSVAQPTPFGDPSTTSTATTSTIGESTSTSGTGLAASNSATAVPVKPNSMSGGAIAGIAIGAVVAVAVILVTLWFLFQKHHKKQAQQQGKQTYRGPYPLQDQGLYDQYGKLVYSPPWSPQNHFHHQSDVYSELDAGLLSPDPSHKSSVANPSGISEADGGPFSPETIQESPPSSHGFSDGGQQNRPVELPVYR